MALLNKSMVKKIVIALVIALLCSNGAIALALTSYTAEQTTVSPRKVTDDIYLSASLFNYVRKYNDTWFSIDFFGSSGGDNAHSPTILVADDDSLETWRVTHDGGEAFWYTENFVFTIVQGFWSGNDNTTIHYSEDLRTWYEVEVPGGYTISWFIGGNDARLDYLMFSTYKYTEDYEYEDGVLLTKDFSEWYYLNSSDFPEADEGFTIYTSNIVQGDSDDWYVYGHFYNTNRQTAEDSYGTTRFYKTTGLPDGASGWEEIGEYDGIASIAYTSNGAAMIVDMFVPPEDEADKDWNYGYGAAFYTDSDDWNTLTPISQGSISSKPEHVQLEDRAKYINGWDEDSYLDYYQEHYEFPENAFDFWAEYAVEWAWQEGAEYFRGVTLTTDGGETFFTPNIYWLDELVYPLPPLTGAENWAIEELELAIENDLVLDAMLGNWSKTTTRLQAAEVIVGLVETLTGSTIYELAASDGFDLSDSFADTNSIAATFLKAAGISNGVDGVNYNPTGIFNRIEMVTMLGRMARNIFGIDISAYPPGSESFTDLPDWSGTDEAVGWAVAAEVTNGIGGGLFDSFGPLQNQHTGVFAYRAYTFFLGVL